MEFIGREKEQSLIKSIISKRGYQGCIIYGRRRMGKTELVKHCLLGKGVPFIMYQCKESSERDNVIMLTELIKKELGMPYLSFETFMDAIGFLFEYSKEKELYFVLDEYPYIRNIIDGCDSKLQEIIDRYAMDCRMKLFLLGSSISTMEDVIDHKSPLYMRFTSSILLKQMDYYDSSLFYKDFSDEDKVRAYSAFGGVPFYNAQIDDSLTLKENIIHIISGQFSGLKDFLDTYLKEELRKINNANVVFEAIALGAFHFSDILAKSHVDSSAALSVILQKLVKMDLVEYVSPINDKNNKQKAGYRISDYCVRFYYNFIYRSASAHSILSDDAFYDKYIAHDFNAVVVPNVFETISKQFLIRQNLAGKMDPILIDIGTYWYDCPSEKKNGQFDVVAKSDDGYVFFECKFKEGPITDAIIKEEIAQVEKTTLKPIQYGFISKNGFKTSKAYPYLFYSLADLYR